MPGDVTASEVYADRELLNRLGYGIFDVQWGQSGAGFENVRDFSYVVAPHDDPKLYRHKVFELTGRYFRNDLAKAIWDKFIDHKWVMSERAGHEVDLKTAADDWIEKYSHAFLKDWTFNQPKVPFRIRTRKEPRKGLLDLVAQRFFPNLRELLDSGFTVSDIAWAAAKELRPIHPARDGRNKKGRLNGVIHKEKEQPKEEQPPEQYFVVKKLQPQEKNDFNYIRLVASLTGHEIKDQAEAEKRWREILEHRWYMSEREGRDVGIKAAALDYYRRLNLLQETEQGVD